MAKARASGALSAISRALGSVRWAFMPLGLFALLAVGIHAGADTVSERLLWVTDRIAEAWDHAVGSFDLTSGLVGAISFAARTRVARGLALCWELACDVALALPALGYDEKPPSSIRSEADWRGQLRRVVKNPTTLRVLRPIETAAFALAGACAVAKMVQGALYLDLRSLAGEDVASPIARFAAVLAIGAVGVALGLRALQRALEHADERSETEARTPATRLTAGLIGSAIALPLALAAFVDASPVLAFFR